MHTHDTRTGTRGRAGAVLSDIWGRDGSAYVLVMVAIPALMAVMALSLDMGRLAAARQELQVVADSAALAGAARSAWGPLENEVKAEVVSVAADNSVLGEPISISAEDVVIGLYDPDTGSMTSGWPSDRLPQVKVTVNMTADSDNGAIPMTFSKFFGVQEMPLTASAVAGLTCEVHPRDPVELAIVQDCSGSFVEEIEMAKTACGHLVDLFDDNYIEGDRMALCTFNTDGHLVEEADPSLYELMTQGGAIPERTADMHTIIDWINTEQIQVQYSWWWSSWEYVLPVEGYTYTDEGIGRAHNLLTTYGSGDAAEQVIVLLSDGMPNPDEHRQMAVDACDAAAADNIRIHTVTYDEDSSGGAYGSAGSDAQFNASLVRNGGYAFHTPDASRLEAILEGVGAIEIGHPQLIQ